MIRYALAFVCFAVAFLLFVVVLHEWINIFRKRAVIIGSALVLS